MDRTSSSDSSDDSPSRLEDDILDGQGDLFPPTNFGKETFPIALKRNYPGRQATFGSMEGPRDAKARRKDPRGGPGSSSLWDAMGGSGATQVRQRDELVDTALVEQLRNQFGDPFDESVLKKAAGTSP
ncbi:hypothetical protein C8Q77DRAFT_1060039 [Trametes polyzona]|nr:hypothetical protein C8Q77DRAFT_1060039 [Trametes polyzona]